MGNVLAFEQKRGCDPGCDLRQRVLKLSGEVAAGKQHAVTLPSTEKEAYLQSIDETYSGLTPLLNAALLCKRMCAVARELDRSEELGLWVNEEFNGKEAN